MHGHRLYLLYGQWVLSLRGGKGCGTSTSSHRMQALAAHWHVSRDERTQVTGSTGLNGTDN